MKKYSIPAVFALLVGTLGLIIISFFWSGPRDLIAGKQFLLLLLAIFILGGLLVFLTLRQKVKKPLKKFLILTGASATGFCGFSVLHNLFYALAELTQAWPIFSQVISFIGAAFFLIAALGCPIGFLVGIIGSLYWWIKKASKK